MKKLMSLLLVLTMILAMVPVVGAETEETAPTVYYIIPEPGATIKEFNASNFGTPFQGKPLTIYFYEAAESTETLNGTLTVTDVNGNALSNVTVKSETTPDNKYSYIVTFGTADENYQVKMTFTYNGTQYASVTTTIMKDSGPPPEGDGNQGGGNGSQQNFDACFCTDPASTETAPTYLGTEFTFTPNHREFYFAVIKDCPLKINTNSLEITAGGDYVSYQYISNGTNNYYKFTISEEAPKNDSFNFAIACDVLDKGSNVSFTPSITLKYSANDADAGGNGEIPGNNQNPASASKYAAFNYDGKDYVVGFGVYSSGPPDGSTTDGILNLFGSGGFSAVGVDATTTDSVGWKDISGPNTHMLSVYLAEHSVDASGANYFTQYTGDDISFEIDRMYLTGDNTLVNYNKNDQTDIITLYYKTGPNAPYGSAQVCADVTINYGGTETKETIVLQVEVFKPSSNKTIELTDAPDGKTKIQRLESAIEAALDEYDQNPQATHLTVIMEEGEYDGTITIPSADGHEVGFGPPNMNANTGIMLHLVGNREGTVVSGGININDHAIDIADICFEANDSAPSDESGTTKALYNGACLNTTNCSFTGYDIALDAGDKGHITATSGNTFLDNGIAIRVNISGAQDSNRIEQTNNNFYHNDIAVQILSLNGWTGMYYYRIYNSNFIDNRVDYDVPCNGVLYPYCNYYGVSNPYKEDKVNSRYLNGILNAVKKSPKAVENVLTNRPARLSDRTTAEINTNPCWKYPVYDGVKYTNYLITILNGNVSVVTNSTDGENMTEEEYEAANYLKLDDAVTRVSQTTEEAENVDTRIINSEADSLLMNEVSFENDKTVHVVEGIGEERATLGTWTFKNETDSDIQIVSNDTDSGSFNAKLTIDRSVDNQISVTVEDSAVLTAKRPTLSIPCDFEYATVTCEGEAVDFVLDTENDVITFVVEKGGEYVITKGEAPDDGSGENTPGGEGGEGGESGGNGDNTGDGSGDDTTDDDNTSGGEGGEGDTDRPILPVIPPAIIPGIADIILGGKTDVINRPASSKVNVMDFVSTLDTLETQSSKIVFTDVAEADWFCGDVMSLVYKGIISGYPDGSFRPQGEVTWGEALKLVLLASRYGQQAPTGDHWASGYMDLAIKLGFLSGSVNLDAPITRGEMADLTAAAMKLGSANISNPFDDEAPASALALYEAGIIKGSADNGKLLYRAESTITRAEMAAIIWRVYCAK